MPEEGREGDQVAGDEREDARALLLGGGEERGGDRVGERAGGGGVEGLVVGVERCGGGREVFEVDVAEEVSQRARRLVVVRRPWVVVFRLLVGVGTMMRGQ